VLNFCKFRANTNIDLELDCIFRKPESNTILCEKYVILPIQTNAGANAEKSPKQPLPLGVSNLVEFEFEFEFELARSPPKIFFHVSVE